MTSHNVLPHSPPHKRPIGYAAIAAVLFTVLTASGCSKDTSSEAPASAADPVVARVNGVDIRQSDLALAEEDLGADMQAVPPEAKRDHLISYLADIIMVTQDRKSTRLNSSHVAIS